MTSRRPNALLILLAAGTLAPQAFASGFQLREQSPSAQGSAFAGVSAQGSDISAMFFNPATLTAFEGFQCVIGGSFVAPKAEMRDAAATRASLPAPLTPFGATSIDGPSSHPDAAQDALLPAFYALWSANRNLKLGLSINVPFGLVTEYAPAFRGRYHALKSDLQTADIAFHAAYRLSPILSAGASILFRRVDAELSNAVDFGEIAFLGLARSGNPAYTHFLPSAGAAPFDGKATIRGSGSSTGFKAGILFEPSSTFRAGLSYHGGTNTLLKGNVAYAYPSIASAPLAGAVDSVASSAHLVNGTVRAELKLPSQFSIGLSWDALPGLNLGLEAARTQWSSFRELRMQFGSGQADAVTREDWRNTWFCSLGARWKVSQALTLRAGIATDQGAAPDSTRTPRIPDGDRRWFSAGMGWAFTGKVGVDLAYTHIAMRNSTLALTAGTAESPDFFRGNLTGTFRDSIEILACSTRIRF